MSARAYRWGMTKSVDWDIVAKQKISRNMVALWMAMQITDDEVKQCNAKMMEMQVERCKDRTRKAKVTGEKCMAPACENNSTESRGKLLWCAKCRKALYCSQVCQLAHWPEHKMECKLWRGQL